MAHQLPDWRALAEFWLAVVVTGLGTGLATAALTKLLEFVQQSLWSESETHLPGAAARAAVDNEGTRR